VQRIGNRILLEDMDVAVYDPWCYTLSPESGHP